MIVNQELVKRLIPFMDVATERDVEIPFVLNNLPIPDHNTKVLDVSCAYSQMLLVLNEMGFDAWGIDLLDYGVPTTKFVRADARQIPFPDKTFDVITNISALEHYGLVETPYNTDTVYDQAAAFKAMQEMNRILKDDGKLILTLPFGFTNSEQTLKWIKFYKMSEINELLSATGFAISTLTVSKYTGDPEKKNGIWVETSTEDGEKIETKGIVICNICMVLNKTK